MLASGIVRGVAVIVAIISLVATGSAAQAASLPVSPITGKPVLLIGDTRPRHLAWVQQMQAPLPTHQVSLVPNLKYGPMFYRDFVVFLPLPTEDWNYAAERASLFHELGHAFDFSVMTPGYRDEFKALLGTTCKWLDYDCEIVGWRHRRGPRPMQIAPAEAFAEIYAASAAGKTKQQADAERLPSYGWWPRPDVEQQMRSLIVEAART